MVAGDPLIPQHEVVVGGPSDGQAGPDLDHADPRGVVDAQPGGRDRRPGHLEDERVGRVAGGIPGHPGMLGTIGRARASVDGVREAGVDPDVRALDRGVGEEVDLRAVDEGVVVGAGEHESGIGELARERVLHFGEPLEVVRVQADDEAVRHEGPIGRGQPFGLHRPLDPALQLHGLHPGAEQTSRRALEEAFEEPLDGGQRRHGWWRSLAEGRRRAPHERPGPSPPDPVPPWGEPRGAPAILLAAFGWSPPRRSPREPGA